MPLSIDSSSPIAAAPAARRSLTEGRPSSPADNRIPEGSQASQDAVELTPRARLLTEVDALLHPAAAEDGDRYAFPPLQTADEGEEERDGEAPSPPPLGRSEEREQTSPFPGRAAAGAPQQNASPEQPAPLAPPISNAVPDEPTPILSPPPAPPVSPSAPEASGAPRENSTPSDEEIEKEEKGVAGQEELTEEEQREVQELKNRDREVRAHEQAHLATAGSYARGGPRYDYESGPDRKRYAVGGEVSIDTSPISGDPEATIRKAQVVRRAALAPAEPSPQDRRIATEAGRMESKARQKLSRERMEEMREGGEGGNPKDDRRTVEPSPATPSPEPRESDETGGKIDQDARSGSRAAGDIAADNGTPSYGEITESRPPSAFAPADRHPNGGGLPSIEDRPHIGAIPEPGAPSASDASPESVFSGSATLDSEEIPEVDTGANMGGIAVLKKFNGYSSRALGGALDLTA